MDQSPRGLTILETVVAGALLGTLLIGCLQVLTATASQRRAADRRQCAIQELSNVMERVAARPWADLSTDAVAAEKLSPSAADRLPGAELKVEISTLPSDPNAKRITAALQWESGSNRPRAEVNLSTLKYRVNN